MVMKSCLWESNKVSVIKEFWHLNNINRINDRGSNRRRLSHNLNNWYRFIMKKDQLKDPIRNSIKAGFRCIRNCLNSWKRKIKNWQLLVSRLWNSMRRKRSWNSSWEMVWIRILEVNLVFMCNRLMEINMILLEIINNVTMEGGVPLCRVLWNKIKKNTNFWKEIFMQEEILIRKGVMMLFRELK